MLTGRGCQDTDYIDHRGDRYDLCSYEWRSFVVVSSNSQFRTPNSRALARPYTRPACWGYGTLYIVRSMLYNAVSPSLPLLSSGRRKNTKNGGVVGHTGMGRCISGAAWLRSCLLWAKMQEIDLLHLLGSISQFVLEHDTYTGQRSTTDARGGGKGWAQVVCECRVSRIIRPVCLHVMVELRKETP